MNNFLCSSVFSLTFFHYFFLFFFFLCFQIMTASLSIYRSFTLKGDTALKYSALFSGEMSLGNLNGPLLREKKGYVCVASFVYCPSLSILFISFAHTLFLTHAHIFSHTSSQPSLLVPLDIDVVDTTDLQDNIHSVRHSAFNVNRVILEVRRNPK